jgi:hypothetical protein
MNDPEALRALRAADNAYHAVCIDIQEPDVPASELPLDDLARAAQGVLDAVARLRGTSG